MQRLTVNAMHSFSTAILCFIAIFSASAGMAPNSVKAGQPAAQAAQGRVSAELIAERAAITPGQKFIVALRQRIQPGWHTYWINPGDSGEPTAIEWKLPEGFKAGAVEWPLPEAFTAGQLVSFGYAGEVLLLAEIEAPDRIEHDRVTLAAQVRWVACKHICVPGEADVSLVLPVSRGGEAPASRHAAAIAKARQAQPGDGPQPACFTLGAGNIALRIGGIVADRPQIRSARFYPLSWGEVSYSAPQNFSVEGGNLTIELQRGDKKEGELTSLNGVLVIEESLDGSPVRRGYVINAKPAAEAS